MANRGCVKHASPGGVVCQTAATPLTSSQKSDLGFKQLFDDDSSTFSYLLWDQYSKDAVLIDPVDVQLERDLKEIESLGLSLLYGINTHAHADHITGTGLLKERIPSMKSIISEKSKAKADIKIFHGDEIHFGSRFITARATPGHTEGCFSYVMDDMTRVFTGDALLILGCGRTDFQGGDSCTLYDSVHTQLFSLPDECVVYPAHDYKGQTSSSIQKEETENPRLGTGKTKDEFIKIMSELKLSYPKHIDKAVPTNMRCGVPDVTSSVYSQ